MEESRYEPMGFDEFRETIATRIGNKVTVSWREGKENRSAILSGSEIWETGDFSLEFSNVTQVYQRQQVPASDCPGQDFSEDAVIRKRGGVISIEESGFSVLIHPSKS